MYVLKCLKTVLILFYCTKISYDISHCNGCLNFIQSVYENIWYMNINIIKF